GSTSNAYDATNCIALGQSSLAQGSADCIAIGNSSIAGSSTSHNDSIAIGNTASAQATFNIAIGSLAVADFDYSIAIGPASTATASRQFVCGGTRGAVSNGSITDVYFGGGVQTTGSVVASSYVIHGARGAVAK